MKTEIKNACPVTCYDIYFPATGRRRDFTAHLIPIVVGGRDDLLIAYDRGKLLRMGGISLPPSEKTLTAVILRIFAALGEKISRSTVADMIETTTSEQVEESLAQICDRLICGGWDFVTGAAQERQDRMLTDEDILRYCPLDDLRWIEADERRRNNWDVSGK